jgi:uncharacterized protein YndB with AHSA1/START domain
VNGTLHTTEGRPSLRFERRLAHPVENVWRAISEPAELTHWFPADVEVDLRPGGAIRFAFRENEGPPGSGEVTELDPPEVLEYTWDESVLRFELRPEGDGCLLVFTHTFDAPDEAAKFAAGWHLCLEGLESLLAGAPGSGSMDRWGVLHEGYVERFA